MRSLYTVKMYLKQIRGFILDFYFIMSCIYVLNMIFGGFQMTLDWVSFSWLLRSLLICIAFEIPINFICHKHKRENPFSSSFSKRSEPYFYTHSNLVKADLTLCITGSNFNDVLSKVKKGYRFSDQTKN